MNGRILVGALVAVAWLGAGAWMMLTESDAPIAASRPGRPATASPPVETERPDLVDRVIAERESEADAATGQIVGPDLEPVRGVRVVLLTVPETTVDPDLRWLFEHKPRPLWSAHSTGTTDDGGRYTLDAAAPSARTMLAIDPGGPRAALFSDLPQTAVGGLVDHGLLVLPRRVAFTGQVVDAAGRPAARAILRFVPEFHLPWNGALSDLSGLHWIVRARPLAVAPAPHCLAETFSIVPTRRVRADRSGRFLFLANPGLDGVVSIDHPGFERAFEDVTETRVAKEIELGSIRLAPSCAITGTVRDENGAPVEGAEIGAGAHDGESGLAYRFTESDADGAFALKKLFDRDHVVLFRRPGEFDWASRDGVWVDSDPIELTLRRRRALDVKVVDAEGAPILDAEIALDPSDDDRTAFERALAPRPPRRAPDGTARVEGLESRPYFVAARAPGFAPQQGEVDLSRNDRELWVTLDPECALPVRVLDGDTGLPVLGARVVAREVDAESSIVSNRLLGRIGAGLTDDEGRVTIGHLGPGRYQVKATHPRYASQSRLVRAPSEETTVTIDRGGAITGRLTMRGRPLPGRRMRLALHDIVSYGLPQTRIALTAADGSFAFGSLPVGSHKLELRLAEGYVIAGGLPHGSILHTTPDTWHSISVQRGETRKVDYDIAEEIGPERVFVEGVLRCGGVPLAGRLVQAWVDAPDDGWSAATVTGPDGSFMLGWADAPRVTLVVDSAGYEKSHNVDGEPISINIPECPAIPK